MQLQIVIMCEDVQSGPMRVWRISLPCKLQRTQHGTAEFVRDAHASARYIPRKPWFLEHVPVSLRLEMLDRDAANVKYSRHQEALSQCYLCVACSIHMMHGSAQRV